MNTQFNINNNLRIETSTRDSINNRRKLYELYSSSDLLSNSIQLVENQLNRIENISENVKTKSNNSENSYQDSVIGTALKTALEWLFTPRSKGLAPNPKPTSKGTSKGTFLSNYCQGTNQWATYDDGSNGTYSEILQLNSSNCGYIPPIARGTFLSNYCKGSDQWATYSNNNGIYSNIIENNSSNCGYIPPIARGTLLSNYCKGSDQWATYANGSNGTYDQISESNYFDCFKSNGVYPFNIFFSLDKKNQDSHYFGVYMPANESIGWQVNLNTQTEGETPYSRSWIYTTYMIDGTQDYFLFNKFTGINNTIVFNHYTNTYNCNYLAWFDDGFVSKKYSNSNWFDIRNYGNGDGRNLFHNSFVPTPTEGPGIYLTDGKTIYYFDMNTPRNYKISNTSMANAIYVKSTYLSKLISLSTLIP